MDMAGEDLWYARESGVQDLAVEGNGGPGLVLSLPLHQGGASDRVQPDLGRL